MMSNFELILDFMEVYKKLSKNERAEVREEAPEGIKKIIDIIDNMPERKTAQIPVFNIPMVSDERWNEITKNCKVQKV